MKQHLTILTCLISGLGTMFMGASEWRMIGAVVAFFGCWLLSQKVQLRRINREIDRFEDMEKRRLITSRPALAARGRAPRVRSAAREWLDTRTKTWTENFCRAIMLDSGARKA